MPAAAPPRAKELSFPQTDIDTTHRTEDGNIAVILTGGVNVRYRDEKGNLLEFLANSAVMFTDLKTFKGVGIGQDKKSNAEHVNDIYFEGDVRVYTTPADTTHNNLRMEASRVYYELATDRAVVLNLRMQSERVEMVYDFQRGELGLWSALPLWRSVARWRHPFGSR